MRVLTLLAVVGLVAAAPRPQEHDLPSQVASVRERRSPLDSVPIIEDLRVGPDADGNFFFRYTTGDGIVHEARGTNSGDGIVRVSGSYSYVSPEGEPIRISYTADENGFQTRPGIQVDVQQEVFRPQPIALSVAVDRDSGGRPG